jgi:hypothetical protein
MVACYAPADPSGAPLAVYQVAVDYSFFDEDVPPTCSVECGFYRPCESLPPADACAVRAEGLREFLSLNGMWLVTDPTSI